MDADGAGATRPPVGGPSPGLAAFVATSVVTSGLALDDVYPLSRYPMYSAARVGQYEVAQVTFSGVAADGSLVGLGRPASRQVCCAWQPTRTWTA